MASETQLSNIKNIKNYAIGIIIESLAICVMMLVALVIAFIFMVLYR